MAEYSNRETKCDNCIHNKVCYLREICNDIVEQIKDFGCNNFRSTDDVVEVVHGEWIEHDIYVCNSDDDSMAKIGTIFICSECGREEDNKEPYCNCGAKMDGKGDAE